MFFCRQLHDLLSTGLSVDISVCLDEFRIRLLWLSTDLFSVIHASVADLDGIAVEYFSEFVLFRKVFVY